MTIAFAAFRYGIRFDETSYVLRVSFNASDDNVTFPPTGSLDPNTDYFFSEDGSSTDLCALLAAAIASHSNGEIAACSVTVSPTTHKLVILVTPVGSEDSLQLLWSHASVTLDAAVFGFLDGVDSDIQDFQVTSPNVPMGLVYLGQPVKDDGRPRQGIIGGSARALIGDVETTTLDDPYNDRSLEVLQLHRSRSLEEYASSDAPYATLESMHVRALARGHRIHYLEDDTDPDTYSLLKLVPPLTDTIERDDSMQSRMFWKWSGDFVELPIVVETPFSEYSYAFTGVAPDAVSMGDVATFDGATRVTWSWWQYNDEAVWSGDTTGIMSKYAAAQSCFDIRRELSRRIRVLIATSLTTGATALTPNDTFTTRVWEHVVVVFNGTLSGNSNRLRIYVNGVDVGVGTFSGTIPAALTSGSTSNFIFGGTGNANSPFLGNLDEIAVWVGTAATAGQVTGLYNGGTPADVTLTTLGDPTFWFRADGDVVPTATDQGTAGIDGTFAGAASLSTLVP